MPLTAPHAETPRKPLRLWPGVIVAILMVILRFAIAPLVPGAAVVGVLAGVAGGLIILLWWLFFSRAPWFDRIAAIVTMAVATLLTWLIVDPSIAGGLMGRMVPLYAVPSTLGPAFVAWAVATRRSSDKVRRLSMAATILLACAVWALVRTEGVKGEGLAQLRWRWTPTAEERLLAQGDDTPAQPAVAPRTPAETAAPPRSEPAAPSQPAANAPAAPTAAAPETKATPAAKESSVAAESATTARAVRVEWPGFRGTNRDGIVRGVRVQTDWAQTPPKELWRRPIGPGWSSFAVRGDLIYTQEQRGDEEVVSCYRLSTGQPVWRHRDATRFYESNGGAGPRGTPAVHDDHVYSLGATGIVNALNAETGAVVWSRNAATDTGATLPGWGFTSSPLVVDDLLIVATSGRLVAYERTSGNPRWTRRTKGGGYSSPHLVTIDDVSQVVLLSGGGATGVSLADGNVLWEHSFVEGTSILQPVVLPDGDLVIAAGDMMGGQGLRRLSIAHKDGAWIPEERWTSRGLKPYYNDFVVHKGFAFGFDGTILSCIDVQTGERKWKGGRYGAGQLMLLPEQDLLLVVSEDGELVLVAATPDKHDELARFKAIEGKTWNHPTLVKDVLLVRNGEEMAAFRLALAIR